MLPKVIGVIILAAVIWAFPPTHAYAIPFFVIALAAVFVIEGVRVVPQQSAWVVERWGRYHATLQPGLNIIVPFIDRVAYRHSLKEVPLDVPEQVSITRDNTQLGVDGILYFQVTDPRLASYGTSDYITAITQLSQTTLRSEVGKMELDKTLESRDEINKKIVAVLDEAGRSWGVKVLRYEIKNLTPPDAILRAMQAQITAEREKRAVIATSEGEKQKEINLAEGSKQSDILKSEGEKQAAINKAQGDAPRSGWSPRRPRRASKWSLTPSARRAACRRPTSRSPSSTSAPSATWPRPTTRSSSRATCPTSPGWWPRP